MRPRTNTATDLISALSLDSEKSSVFGLIIDATGQYKTPDSYDFITRLKIIDHSFNSQISSHPFQNTSFCYVFIYSKTQHEGSIFGKIGDIIHLQNFKFSIFQNKPKATFHSIYSPFTLYDGRVNANFDPLFKSDPSIKSLIETQIQQIHRLREWGSSFLKSHSLYKMNWFKRELPMNYTDEIIMLEDVDVIVKLVSFVSIEKYSDFYQKFVFVDKKKRIYFSELKGVLEGIEQGDVLKLRSVKIIRSKDEYRVQFMQYSNFMKLEKNFYDARLILEKTKKIYFDRKKLIKLFFRETHLNKRTKIILAPNTYLFSIKNDDHEDKTLNDKTKTLKMLFPILKTFTITKSMMNIISPDNRLTSQLTHIGSTTLDKYKNMACTSLSDLSLIFKSKSKKIKGRCFKVNIRISSIINSKFESNFKIYSKKQNQTWNINTPHHDFPSDAKILFYNVFEMRDDSLSPSSSSLFAYLLTYDHNPSNIYNLWKILPDHLSIKEWILLSKNKRSKFETTLQKLISSTTFYQLIIKIVESKEGMLYLQIIDSIFLLPIAHSE